MAYKNRNLDENGNAESPETVLRRQKLLYLLKLLYEETDEGKGLSQPVIKARLEEKNISVNRKAMYYDIEAINKFCYDNGIDFEIECSQGRNADYRVTTRPFELGELKLLCDAVSSAKFITKERVDELIKKISMLGSVKDRDSLKRNLVVTSRKCVLRDLGNTVLLNVDEINKAINNKQQIQFQYYQYNTKGKRVERGGIRRVSPYNLIWNDEQYYLIGCLHEEGKAPQLRNFRVDRMDKVCAVRAEKGDKANKYAPPPKGYKVSELVSQAFSMFTTDAVQVSLLFKDAKWMNAVIDRFGTDARISSPTENSFEVSAKIQPSSPFYGWLFQFGSDVEILAPAAVREEYHERVKSLCDALNAPASRSTEKKAKKENIPSV